MENKDKLIKVEDFLAKYRKLTSEELKTEYIKSLIRSDMYIGYAHKVADAEAIINECCVTPSGFIQLDSAKKYIMYVYYLLSNYTTLDISTTDIVNQYDLLEECGTVDIFIANIPQKEVTSFQTILNMKQDDLMVNKYEIHSFIHNSLNELYPRVENIIHPTLEVINKALESLDEKKIIGLLKKMK